MCTRFVTSISAETLTAQFGLKEVPILETHYNVAPGRRVGIIRSTDGNNRVELFRWGILPNYAPGQDPASPMINVESERLEENPELMDAFRHNRCIVPVSGFYEWPHHGENRRQPYYFHMTDHSPMCLAALCAEVPVRKGKEGSFALLTTAANHMVGELHDRMPVILPSQAYRLWLNGSREDLSPLLQLLKPYPEEELSAYKVPELVNNPRYDSRACLVKV